MGKYLLFFFVTLSNQGFSALVGLLLARWLDINEYALYTLFMTISGAIQVLSKGGVHLGLNAVTGQGWPDKGRVSGALNFAISIRKKLSLYVLPIMLLISVCFFYKNGASVENIIGLLFLLVINWICDYKTRVADTILMYASAQNSVAILDAIIASVRLVLLIVAKFIFGLNILLATAINVLPFLIRIPVISIFLDRVFPNRQCFVIHNEDRKKIIDITKRQFPMELFYCIQSPFIYFILTWFNNTTAIASLGALGRIGQLFVPISSILASFAIPYFVRKKNKLVLHLCQLSLIAVIPAIMLITISFFFPNILLYLVGDNYSNLNFELFLACIGFSINLVASFLWQLIAHRGWNHFVYIQIPVVIIWCVLVSMLVNIKSLSGVLYIQLAFPLSITVSCLADLYYSWKKKLLV